MAKQSYLEIARTRAAKQEVQPISHRIYLAGKMRNTTWRGDLLDWRDHSSSSTGDDGSDWDERSLNNFPGITCVGPYFIGSGCGHDDHCPCESEHQDVIVAKCLRAIQKCDAVFAWIDRQDNASTLVEIGYALGLGKKIVLGLELIPDTYDDRAHEWDYWFLHHLLVTGQCVADNPLDAFKDAIRCLGWSRERFASPLEEAFWCEWQRARWNMPLVPQFPVLDRYRLDFAHVETKTAIELDGITYHGDEKAFQHDRERDRRLAANGWTVLRFAGSEIRESVEGCASSVHGHILGRLSGRI